MPEVSYSPLGQHPIAFMSRRRKSLVIGFTGLLILVIFIASATYGPTGSRSAAPSFDELIRQLWEPEKLDITAPVFVDQDGDTFRLPREPLFKKKLGKRLVILDIDTRPFDHEGELLNPMSWDWNKVGHLSAGMMGHYLYSVIHGYDYLMIRSPRYEDRHDAWGKVLMMQHALKTHDWVVFLDSDAILANPEVPMEWLFNYWRVDGNTSIAIGSESTHERDKDDRGNPGQNTGFMMVQNIPRAHEIYRAWAECPEEKHYAGCAKWKQEHLREQTAFSNYVVYDFREDIKILPCTEANGYPEQYPVCKCKGIFLRHHWMHKQLTKDMFAHNVMRMFAPRIHKQYMDRYNEIVEDLRDKKLVGSEMVDQQ